MILAILPSLDHYSSGPSYSVPQLCHEVERRGEDICLFTATSKGARNHCGINHHAFPLSPIGHKQLQYSLAMNRAVRELYADIDVLYCNGMWAMTASQPVRIAQSKYIPTFLAPRGCLAQSALAQSVFKKRVAWPLMHKRAFERAHCLHATSEKEYEEIRAFGLTAPVAIISNGVSIPENTKQSNRKRGVRTVLFLGRLHPIKGIDLLIDAWASLPKECSANWQLKVAGPDVAGIKVKLQEQTVRLGIQNIHFEDEKRGKEKRAVFYEADLVVLPSKTENFGMVIAEALASGTPVITTTDTPWSTLIDNECGWWVAREVSALQDGLEDAMCMSPNALKKMGERGRHWMQQEFSWEKVTDDFLDVIDWLRTGKRSNPPVCVVTD